MRGFILVTVLAGALWGPLAQATITFQEVPQHEHLAYVVEFNKNSVLEVLTHPSLGECLAEFIEKAESEDRHRTRMEHAVWIVYDAIWGDFSCVWWPRENQKVWEMTWRGPIPQNTVLQIHSHPFDSLPLPSEADHKAANQINLPVVVITVSTRHIEAAFPGFRNSIRIHRGDPLDLIGL